jgi:hypothetical protein
MEDLYGDEEGIPEAFWDVHRRIKTELTELKKKTGKAELPPSYFK